MNKKPESMSFKDFAYRKVSLGLDVPLPIVKKVLDNQFRTMLSIMDDPKINSIEIAGFGKLLTNTNRVKKAIADVEFFKGYFRDKLESGEELSEKERDTAEKYLRNAPQRMKDLRFRLQEHEKKKRLKLKKKNE